MHDLTWALHHLYDPAELRKSRLNDLLGLDPQRPSALRQTLLTAIETLKPRETVPPQAKAWRVYQALSYRYAEQFAQQEVARTLGIGIRHQRRLETLGMRMLADYLCERYGLSNETDDNEGREMLSVERIPPATSPIPTREQELEWIERISSNERVALDAVVDAVLKIVAPLQQALDVMVSCDLPQGLPPLTVHSAPLRQAFLSVLTAAIRAVPGGGVSIGAAVERGCVHLTVWPTSSAANMRSENEDQHESLEMASRLITVSGGSLKVESEGSPKHPFRACLVLPASEMRPVLIVDDNEDTLKLFQRYLTGTRYPCVTTRDPQGVLKLAQELNPQAIVLDVMLPSTDGWELLGHLREHPATRAIPTIICTILAESQLALALGAAAFLRKPVNRADLLSALDRLMGSPA